jgi:integrase
MCTHLKKREGRYYIRRRAPADLVAILGYTEFNKSLRTSDREEAKRRLRIESVRLDTEWALLRAQHAASKDKTALENVLTAAQFAADAERTRLEDAERDSLENDEWYQSIAIHARDEGLDEDEALKFDRKVERRAQMERAVERRRDADANRQPGQKERASAPLQVDRHQPHLSKPPTLRDVVPSWVARNAPKDDAVRRTERAITLFEEAVGIVPLPVLKKAHGAAFVRFLLDQDARGFGRKTAHNYASCVTALLSVAAKDDLIEQNPLDLSFDKSIGAGKREPWTDAELKRMFGHALFSDRMETVRHWHDVAPADGRALLLILLHTGARIGEIAQLRREDFQVRDGMPSIRITAEAGTVKTDESRRTVPLVDHLLSDPWFATWLSKVMDGSRADAPAFPTMAGRVRGPADTAVRWFLGFRKDAGLPLGDLNGSHRFRHWIRTAMNALDVSATTQDAITGHAAGGSTGSKVYTAVPLHVMRAALNRVSYPKQSA